MSDVYDADYFLRGKESGKSLYNDYRWMPDLTIPMVKKIIDHCGIKESDTILDYGCSRGYSVRAFRELGYESYGIDVSRWAIDNCDENVKKYVSCTSNIPPDIDWIIAKDVLEHVPDVSGTISSMMDSAKKGIFVVVPLSEKDGMPYVIPDYELDVTHIHRFTLATWVKFFIRHGWNVSCSHRVRGVKDNYHGWLTWINDNYDTWKTGNGFVTARRI